MIMVLMILMMRLLLAMMRMMVMMCGGTDYDNCNDGTDGKVSDEADVDSIFFLLIFSFSLKKKTKNSVETGRTFATLLCDMETRQLLIEVETEEQFKVMILLIIVTYFIHNSYYTDIIGTEKLAVKTGNKGQEVKRSHHILCVSFLLASLP